MYKKTDRASWWLSGRELLANAGDRSLLPDRGRSHMPWSNEAQKTVEPVCRAYLLQLPTPGAHLCRKRSHPGEAQAP